MLYVSAFLPSLEVHLFSAFVAEKCSFCWMFSSIFHIRSRSKRPGEPCRWLGGKSSAEWPDYSLSEPEFAQKRHYGHQSAHWPRAISLPLFASLSSPFCELSVFSPLFLRPSLRKIYSDSCQFTLSPAFSVFSLFLSLWSPPSSYSLSSLLALLFFTITHSGWHCFYWHH